MKKLLFFGIIIFLTVKITLYFNKKQAQKLIKEKTTSENKMDEKDIKDMTKAMHNYEYLKTKIRKDLKKKVHIKASEVKPVYQNRPSRVVPDNIKNIREQRNRYDQDYERNYRNNNLNEFEDDDSYPEDDYYDEDEEEYDEDRPKPSKAAIQKIRSIKKLIRSRLNRQVEGNINDNMDYYDQGDDDEYADEEDEEYPEERSDPGYE